MEVDINSGQLEMQLASKLEIAVAPIEITRCSLEYSRQCKKCKVSFVSVHAFNYHRRYVFLAHFFSGKQCGVYFWSSSAATEACYNLLESVKNCLFTDSNKL